MREAAGGKASGVPGVLALVKGYWPPLPTLLPHPKPASHLLTPESGLSTSLEPKPSLVLVPCALPRLPRTPRLCIFQKTSCHLHAQPGCPAPEERKLSGTQWSRECVVESESCRLGPEGLGWGTKALSWWAGPHPETQHICGRSSSCTCPLAIVSALQSLALAF